MAEGVQIVAFEGGSLRTLGDGEDSREAVLGLPLNRLIVKMVRVPKETDAVEFATPILKAMSPYPDDPLSVSCEVVREEPGGEKIVIAGAFPENSGDDIGEALDAAKLNVVRIDSLAIGMLRGIWSQLNGAAAEGGAAVRRLVLMRSPDCISIIALDGDQPSAIRAVVHVDDLRREVMLSLLEAEDFGGERHLEEIVVVETDGFTGETPEEAFAALEAFAPLRRLTVGADAALVGISERAGEAGGLDALPESWREVLVETRFKHKLIKYVAIAGGIWLLVMGVLFGVPIGFGFMTDYQKGLSKQHARQYKAVKDMKAKVDLIHKYSDHARGALEIMKAVSDRLPAEIVLSSWDYKREDGVRVRGDADAAEATYKFKDAMTEMVAGEGEDAENIFGSVELTGPTASKNKFVFNLDCQYGKEEEE